jgi:hypothetical protein
MGLAIRFLSNRTAMIVASLLLLAAPQVAAQTVTCAGSGCPGNPPAVRIEPYPYPHPGGWLVPPPAVGAYPFEGPDEPEPTYRVYLPMVAK